jgi:hypothetical protein
MEDVLDLYEEEPDEKHPLVCLDEKPYQLTLENHFLWNQENPNERIIPTNEMGHATFL